MQLNFVKRRLDRRLEKKTTTPRFFCLAVVHATVPHRGKHKRSFVSKNKSIKRRSKVYRNIHLGLGKELQQAELILTQEDSDVPIHDSPPSGKELSKEHFLEVD